MASLYTRLLECGMVYIVIGCQKEIWTMHGVSTRRTFGSNIDIPVNLANCLALAESSSSNMDIQCNGMFHPLLLLVVV